VFIDEQRYDGARDDACKLVQKWCATHKGACNDDTWRFLVDRLFSAILQRSPAMFRNMRTYQDRPKAMLLWLCRRWDRGRLEKYLAAEAAWTARGDLVTVRYAGEDGQAWHDSRHEQEIIDFLKTKHGLDVEDDDEYETENMATTLVFYRVWYFCTWALAASRTNRSMRRWHSPALRCRL